MIGTARIPARGAASGKKPPICPLPKCQTPPLKYVLFFNLHYDSSSSYCDRNVYVLYFNDKELSCNK